MLSFIRILAFNKQILKIKNDNKMTEAEKKTKIAELQTKSDEISKLAEKIPSF